MIHEINLLDPKYRHMSIQERLRVIGAEYRRLQAIEQALIDFQNNMLPSQEETAQDVFNWLHSTTGYKGEET